ncbi:phospho-N-acetylmuramoyl-pentapeptide-transferase [Carnobacteriaceae bacterium zg-ZUI78]|nr:phospho-N-acetylmuramoyl-pentapeptide-transferase [Carnobacteriaceae bacterium zg-ZUI78]
MNIWIELFIIYCASLALTTMMMPFFIMYFTQKKLGQVTREEGPTWHEVKTGTPTMGGVAFVIASIISFGVMALYKGYLNFSTGSLIFVLVAFGIIGFLDDYLKLIRQHNTGLTSKQKFLCQIIFSIIYVLFYLLSGKSILLFASFGGVFSLICYFVFSIIWITGFSNAVNLTDGLDGLVAGTASIALVSYSVIAYQQQQYDILAFCTAILGGLLGFFIFNKKPAKIFMGDVGALALGAVFAVLSMLLHVEFSLLFIGIIFVLETASVMLQVASFKLLGKRIFKMTPIHHHFEMLGWSEWRVVLTFWFIGLLGSLVYFIIV